MDQHWIENTSLHYAQRGSFGREIGVRKEALPNESVTVGGDGPAARSVPTMEFVPAVRFVPIAKSSPPAKELRLRELIEVRPVGQGGTSLRSRHFAHSAGLAQAHCEDVPIVMPGRIGRSRRIGKTRTIAGLMAFAPDQRVAVFSTIAGRVLDNRVAGRGGKLDLFALCELTSPWRKSCCGR